MKLEVSGKSPNCSSSTATALTTYGDNTGSFTVKATSSPCSADDEEDEEGSEARAARASRVELETKRCKLKVRISGTVIRRVYAEKGCDAESATVKLVKD